MAAGTNLRWLQTVKGLVTRLPDDTGMTAADARAALARSTPVRVVRSPLCPHGRVIEPDRFVEFNGAVPPGPCANCGRGPLHGCRRGAPSRCGCSFIRDGVLLCRLCAGVWDVVVVGHTRIELGVSARTVRLLAGILGGPILRSR